MAYKLMQLVTNCHELGDVTFFKKSNMIKKDKTQAP